MVFICFENCIHRVTDIIDVWWFLAETCRSCRLILHKLSSKRKKKFWYTIMDVVVGETPSWATMEESAPVVCKNVKSCDSLICARRCLMLDVALLEIGWRNKWRATSEFRCSRLQCLFEYTNIATLLWTHSNYKKWRVFKVDWRLVWQRLSQPPI